MSKPILESVFLSEREATGTGIARCGDRELPIRFSLSISYDCMPVIEVEFQVDQDTTTELLNKRLNMQRLENCKIEGTTRGGHSLACASANLYWDDHDLTCGPPLVRGRFKPRQKIIIQSPDFESRVAKRVEYGIFNMEHSSYTPSSFTVRGRMIEANRTENYTEATRRLSADESLRAVTCLFSAELADHTEMTELDDMMLKVTMMLSLVQMNDIKPFFSVVYDEDEKPFQWIFYTHLRETRYIKFFNMINDDYVRNGISSYLTQCYDEFDRLHEAFNMYPFLSSQLFAARTRETHFIVLVLIVSLEYLTTHYGETILGWTPDHRLNLKKKLRKLDESIEANLDQHLDSEFQAMVRNPLMHMGIVQISDDDLLSTCYRLHNLSFLMYLKLVRYQGKYLAAEWPPRPLEMR